ncbi:MAG: hypothetical protein LBD80_02000 [Tannerella sp.]|jgi:hypothetical protein|nr:hypothetical protein [Tannerella sp.]
MANNDKIKQVISHIQSLADMTLGMKDAELYPVSFFSGAFDLLQKIKSGFHALEAEQVEMFASQMKKHQDLIVSIHRQMRKKPEDVSMPPPPDEIETNNTDVGYEKNISSVTIPVIIPDKKTAENDVSYPPNIIEKKRLADLRKAFNLNDRFRFLRELFGGKQELMNKTITELNSLQSMEESLTYLDERLHWDMSDSTVNDFIKKLEIRYR